MEQGTEVTGPIEPETQAEVEALLRQRELTARQRERLERVKAAWLGSDVATIARWSGRTPGTVRRWLAAFRDGGVAVLAGAPIPGRPPKADAAYLAAMEAALETAPRDLGLPFDGWTSGRLGAYLETITGVHLAPVGTNRRLTIFGSVEARGRGRIELLTVQQDSAGFARYLAALEARHAATGRQVILV
jgi:transposase